MNYNFKCPKCKNELTAFVDLSKHIVDWEHICDECGHKFSKFEIAKIYDSALIECQGEYCDWIFGNRSDR